MRQDSIPVGCILPTWKLYVFQFQLQPLDTTPGGVQVSPPDVTRNGVSLSWGVGCRVSEGGRGIGYPILGE